MLPDERALRACMAYQDLNPVRAGMADRVDAPEHTSLQRRLEEADDEPERLDEPVAPLRLDPTRHRVTTGGPSVLEVSLRDYREQVEWTGGLRGLHRDDVPKERAPPTIGDPKSWLALVASSRRRVARTTSPPRWTVALA